MSETLLDDSKLADELSAFKRHAEVLGQHKLKFPNTYAPPMEHRHKKPTLVNVSAPCSSHLQPKTDLEALRSLSWSHQWSRSSQTRALPMTV